MNTTLSPIVLEILSTIILLFGILVYGAALYSLFMIFRLITNRRAAPWDLAVFIAVMLFLTPEVIEYWPNRIIQSVRVSAQQSRDEIILFQQEVMLWITQNQSLQMTPIQQEFLPLKATSMSIPEEQQYPENYLLTPTLPIDQKRPFTQTPAAQETPQIHVLPSLTKQPTGTPVPTLDLSSWNVLTPPPTP